MSGSTDHIIRIYQMTPGPPERIAELDVHNVSRLVLMYLLPLHVQCVAPSDLFVIMNLSSSRNCA